MGLIRHPLYGKQSASNLWLLLDADVFLKFPSDKCNREYCFKQWVRGGIMPDAQIMDNKFLLFTLLQVICFIDNPFDAQIPRESIN